MGFRTDNTPFNKIHTMHVIIVLCSLFLTPCLGILHYSNVTKLLDDKLGGSSGYNHGVRPVIDQSNVIEVSVSFDIIAIVEIDAKSQRFIVNGFVGLYWKDELLAWTPSDYNNIYLIHPYPNQIWRPRLVLANTLEDRDLFEDDYSPVIATSDGNLTWLPGSLFPTSCKLNLYKYPFDKQTCYIEMYAMGLLSSEIIFKTRTTAASVGLSYYVESGEWTIVTSDIECTTDSNNFVLFRVSFTLERLPGFFIINIVIPIVLLSFLNILVFLIPVDSGEKISYGITVLLALTVFMSIVSDQLPRSSDTLPLVTVYLLVLNIISVGTVIMSITIVYFHHREEKEVKRHKAKSNFQGMFNKIKVMSRATKTFSQVKQVAPINTSNEISESAIDTSDKTGSLIQAMNRLKGFKGSAPQSPSTDLPQVERGGSCKQTDHFINRWKQIGQHLDCMSFVVFMVIWISVTIGFLVEISR